MKKILLIIGIILLVTIVLGGVALYYYTVGFTPKQKYEKCAKECPELMILESDIPACKAKCAQIHNYNPEPESKTTTTEKTSSKDSDKKDSKDIEYYCEWSWPQQIINKETKKLVYYCPYSRPWCNFGDYKYENVGCCKTYTEETKTKSDCTNLPELLK